MGSLAEALERFNRKERNLLIRDALGTKGNPLQLTAEFRQKVADKLGLTDGIPATAWWATDYHMSWLAGALALYIEGEKDINVPRSNDPSPAGRRLVEGNQEDVDLLIAFHNVLILIEAKAYGTFSNETMASKIARLELLHTFYQSLGRRADHEVRFHFLLISPREPQKLISEWPSWAYQGPGIPWIELPLDTTMPVLKVTRCDAAGSSSASGGHWRVIENKP